MKMDKIAEYAQIHNDCKRQIEDSDMSGVVIDNKCYSVDVIAIALCAIQKSMYNAIVKELGLLNEVQK